MKLTRDHIGKKVTWNSWPGDKYFIPERFDEEGERVFGLSIQCDSVMPDKWWYITGDGWALYMDSRTDFDFSKFGCYSDVIKELVDSLDNRYQKKEK